MSALMQTAEYPAAFDIPRLVNAYLVEKPKDVPADWIAYNPSAIWTVDEGGRRYDIIYLRVEPNHSGADSSHLGKSVVRPYIIDLAHPEAPLRPYYNGMEFGGEDPALTRIKMELANGSMMNMWLLSCVVAEPDINEPNKVATLRTQFRIGTRLNNLEDAGYGPEWMKDIRVVSLDPNGTRLGVYGRPQPEPNSGNITYTTVPNFGCLTPETIANAPYIDENLFPIGSGRWGGANDVFVLDEDRSLVLAHEAEYTGNDRVGKRYEALLLGHRLSTNTITRVGRLATAGIFPHVEAKNDTTTNLSKVVFPGGGYNGKLDNYVSFGVGDSRVGIGRL